MTDISALKALAEKAPVATDWYVLNLANGSDVRARHASGGSTWIAECRTAADAEFIAAASPAVILRLCEVVEKARRTLTTASQIVVDMESNSVLLEWFTELDSRCDDLRSAFAALEGKKE